MDLIVDVDIKGDQWNTTYTVINTDIGEIFKRAMYNIGYGIKRITIKVEPPKEDSNVKVF